MVYMDSKKKIVRSFVIESVLIALVALAFGSLLFISPFYGDLNFIDEGQLGAWGNHMLLGKHMYEDVYIPYGPLYVYPLFVLFKLFSPSASLIRIYMTIGTVISIATINILLYVSKVRTIERRVILLFLILIPGLSFRQGGGFLVLLFIALLLFYKKKSFYFLTGIFSIVSFLISTDIGLFSILVCTGIIFLRLLFSKKIKSEILNLFYFLIGIVLVSSIFFLWSSHEGWFNSYMYTTADALISFSGINSPNGKNFPVPNVISFVISKDGFLYWMLIVYLGAFFYLLIRFILRLLSEQDKIISLLFLYGIVLYVVVIGRPGHIFFVIHPVIIISILFITKLLTKVESNGKREKFFTVVFLTFLCIFYFRLLLIFRQNFVKASFTPFVLFREFTNPFRVGYIEITPNQRNYIRDVQKFVNTNTTKADLIFFLSDEPMMYMLTNKINPTRYDLPFMANIIEKRYELIYDLQKNKPKFIFYNNNAWVLDDVDNFKRIPEIKNLLDTFYTKEYLTNSIFVYRIKE